VIVLAVIGGFVLGQDESEIVLEKAEQGDVEGLDQLQVVQLLAQQISVPVGDQRQHVGASARGPVHRDDARHLGDAKPVRSLDAAVACDDVVGLIDQDRPNASIECAIWAIWDSPCRLALRADVAAGQDNIGVDRIKG
jgi:hypothetical protein